MDDDEKLLRRAEQALSEIKVAQGLSDEHASVLAALRIRLRGDPGKSLDDLLSAAGDLGAGPKIEDVVPQKKTPKRSLDDILSADPQRKAKSPPD